MRTSTSPYLRYNTSVRPFVWKPKSKSGFKTAEPNQSDFKRLKLIKLDLQKIAELLEPNVLTKNP